MNRQTRESVGLLNRLNQLRFDIETYILSHDLNQKESIYGVYDYLEEAVALFENYSKAHNKLASDINGHFNDSNNDLYRAIKLMHGTTKDILRNIRKEQESSIDAKLTKLNSALLVFKATLSNMNLQNEYTTSITDKVSKTVKLVESYQNPGAVPYEHELYGKHYYYHNQILIKYFNWSGPGFVRDMNTLMDGLDISFVKMDEEPLIFKVIYPTKVEKAKELEQAKPELKKRKLTLDSDITFNPTSIKTDSRIVEIELFDNNMIDRDSISVQFNGENILENYSLSGESKFITVTIEDGKENLLIITAKNLGIIPPNTTAVAYRYQGKRQRILIENDLNVSEAIRVKLVKPQD